MELTKNCTLVEYTTKERKLIHWFSVAKDESVSNLFWLELTHL